MKLLLLLLLLFSCASAPKKHAHQHSKSMNEKFMKEDLNVKLWQEKFENRDRDVFKNRTQIIYSLGLKSNQDIVDVGAGTGFFLKGLHKKVAPKGKVYAVELSPRFVDFLKKRGEMEKLDRLKVIKGGLDQTNMKTESVDVVFVCDAFHHFDKPELMLRDFFNILRPGGELVIVDFDHRGETTKKWVKKHVSRTKEDYIYDIEQSGFFKFTKESFPNLKENVMLHFRRN